MEAQELLRKAADIYAQAGNDAYAPKALAEAAGLDPVDIDNLDFTWGYRKDSVRRAEHFFRGIADFLDNKDEQFYFEEVAKLPGVPPFSKDPYSCAIDKLVKERTTALLNLSLITQLIPDSSEKCVEYIDSFIRAYVHDSEYKSSLSLTASIFDKTRKEVHADVMNHPLSCRIDLGINDEY